MNSEPERLAEAERSLRQTLQVMAYPESGYQPEEWTFLATLIGEAGLVLRDEPQVHHSSAAALLDRAVDELRSITKGFTDPTFLKATGAARRRNPALFSSRS
jgi:hypothetical protein